MDGSLVEVVTGSSPTRSAVEVHEAPGHVRVVRLLGEHDMATAADIVAIVTRLQAQGADVVVDLTETRFIDSSVVHALEEVVASAARSGGAVSFHLATRPAVRRVLELTGVLAAWPVYPTRAAAVHAVQRHQAAAG